MKKSFLAEINAIQILLRGGESAKVYFFKGAHTFNSKEKRERILYRNFVEVGQEVKAMIADVLNKKGGI